jgi:hypothetical protein
VIRDLLDVLTAQVADSNSTRLEWIIIWLISVEIIMGIFIYIFIYICLYAYTHIYTYLNIHNYIYIHKCIYMYKYIHIFIYTGIASNPLFAGRRVLASSLVPMFIFGYKRINWTKILKNRI